MKEDILFPLSSSSRDILWRKYPYELESFVYQIDARTYHDFTIDFKKIKIDSIFTRENENRITRSQLFRRQYR